MLPPLNVTLLIFTGLINIPYPIQLELNWDISYNYELPDALDQSFDICARSCLPIGFVQLTQMELLVSEKKHPFDTTVMLTNFAG